MWTKRGALEAGGEGMAVAPQVRHCIDRDTICICVRDLWEYVTDNIFILFQVMMVIHELILKAKGKETSKSRYILYELN